MLRHALALWRGPALVEFASEPFAQVEATRLDGYGSTRDRSSRRPRLVRCGRVAEAGRRPCSRWSADASPAGTAGRPFDGGAVSRRKAARCARRVRSCGSPCATSSASTPVPNRSASSSRSSTRHPTSSSCRSAILSARNCVAGGCDRREPARSSDARRSSRGWATSGTRPAERVPAARHLARRARNRQDARRGRVRRALPSGRNDGALGTLPRTADASLRRTGRHAGSGGRRRRCRDASVGTRRDARPRSPCETIPMSSVTACSRRSPSASNGRLPMRRCSSSSTTCNGPTVPRSRSCSLLRAAPAVCVLLLATVQTTRLAVADVFLATIGELTRDGLAASHDIVGLDLGDVSTLITSVGTSSASQDFAHGQCDRARRVTRSSSPSCCATSMRRAASRGRYLRRPRAPRSSRQRPHAVIGRHRREPRFSHGELLEDRGGRRFRVRDGPGGGGVRFERHHVAELLDEADSAGLAQPADDTGRVYAFTHTLVRDTLYGGIGTSTPRVCTNR